MSSVQWDWLPFVPLRIILNQLSLQDALNASSTCRKWRNAMCSYEGCRDTLVLRASQVQKSEFLTKIFKKKVTRLQIYLDCRDTAEFDQFLQDVLPWCRDYPPPEILFIGPGFSTHDEPDEYMALAELKRPLSEHLDNIPRAVQKLAALGFNMLLQKDLFDKPPTRIGMMDDLDEVGEMLTRCNIKPRSFASLQVISVDYHTIDNGALETMGGLPQLQRLSLTLVNKQPFLLDKLDWSLLDAGDSQRVQLELNIVGMPLHRFDGIMRHVLVPDMPLTALRVMFCEILHCPLIRQVAHFYSNTLTEMQWADAPYDDTYEHFGVFDPRPNTYNRDIINPFIQLCWQCTNLQKLVVHGYWVWQYDLIGMARLRFSTLQLLHVSATFNEQKPANNINESMLAVAVSDKQPVISREHEQQMNRYLQFRWFPTRKWVTLHPALRANSSADARLEYVVQNCAW